MVIGIHEDGTECNFLNCRDCDQWFIHQDKLKKIGEKRDQMTWV